MTDAPPVPAQSAAEPPAPALDLLVPRRRVPDELRVLRRRDWAAVGIVAAVLIGITLRFLSRGGLWLDEAQSVAIAKRPLAQLADALRHDGAPPLYYALLHVWMRVFGDSTFAVRAMSGIPAVLAVPAVLRLGRRIGGHAVGIAAAVLLAVSPFAVRYAVETRMYSLLTLLGILGAHAVLSAHRHRTWLPVVGVFVVSTALLYTHYYAVFLLTAVAAGELWLAWRRRDMIAVRVVGAIVLAGVAFLPWLPVFVYQSKHTGAPWQSPPDGNAVLGTFYAWMGGGRPAAQIAGLIAIFCLLLALIGRRAPRGVVLGTTIARVPAVVLGAVVAPLVLAIVVADIERQAYVARYLAAGVGLFLVVVGCGIAVLPSRRARRALLAVLVAAEISVCASNALQPRTQATQVAAEIAANAKPGDLVVYCPDQLGPSTSRLLAGQGVRQLVFPTFASPQTVDWVDYRQRIKTADPAAFSRAANKLAGKHAIWLVWSLQVKPLAQDCAGVIDHLLSLRGLPQQPVSRNPDYSETMAVDVFRARK